MIYFKFLIRILYVCGSRSWYFVRMVEVDMIVFFWWMRIVRVGEVNVFFFVFWSLVGVGLLVCGDFYG